MVTLIIRVRLAVLTSASSTTEPSTNSSSTRTTAAAEATDCANDGNNGPYRIRQVLCWTVQRLSSLVYVVIVIVVFVFIFKLLVFVLFVVITSYLTIVIFRSKFTKDGLRKRRECQKILGAIIIVPATGAHKFSQRETVKSSQVKSSQVKSSQVKSSQVKSSQVKSSQVYSVDTPQLL